MTLKYIAIPAGAALDPRISPQQLRTLVIIAYYGSLSDREAYPSYKRLCADVGISRRLLITYIKHLCTCGYIEKKERLRPNGSRTSNCYHVPLNIVIDPEAADCAEKSDSTPAVVGGGDAQVHQGSDAGQHPPGDAQVHPHNHTSINKKIKNTKKAEVYTLADWEVKQGAELCADMMVSWIKSNGYDREKVSKLISEFRTAMTAGGNLYADFKACFQNYVNRGYLSQGAAALRLPVTAQPVAKFETHDRGSSL